MDVITMVDWEKLGKKLGKKTGKIVVIIIFLPAVFILAFNISVLLENAGAQDPTSDMDYWDTQFEIFERFDTDTTAGLAAITVLIVGILLYITLWVLYWGRNDLAKAEKKKRKKKTKEISANAKDLVWRYELILKLQEEFMEARKDHNEAKILYLGEPSKEDYKKNVEADKKAMDNAENALKEAKAQLDTIETEALTLSRKDFKFVRS